MWQALRNWISEYAPEIGFVGTISRAIIALPILFAAYLGGKLAVREARLRWHNRHATRDFYYRERMVGYRLFEDGQTYENMRFDEIVPCDEDLGSVPYAYGWTGKGVVKEEMRLLEPADRTGVWRETQPAPGIFQKYFYLDINPKIRRKRLWFWRSESCRVEFKVTARVTTAAPKPYYAIKSDRRVDKLVIRVVFPPNHMPARVVFRVLNDVGQNQETERVLQPDPFTGEHRVEVTSAKPHLRYFVGWDK